MTGGQGMTSSLGQGRRVQQEADAGRDAYVAARDVVIHQYAGQAPSGLGPGLTRHLAWESVPARNSGFTGRGELLAAVRSRLLAGDRVVAQALHGMGGVGKTQLAIEYAHRFAGSYDLVWWIAAEQAGLIGNQYAALAAELGWVRGGEDASVLRRVVMAALAERDRWLLIFDNAEHPGDVATWLPPAGRGHVLITSRWARWSETAVPVHVDVLDRAESVAILQERVAGLSGEDAGRMATALGDLPLAIAQAAAYLAGSGASAAGYLELLDTRATLTLAEGRPASYPRSLAAATRLSIDGLSRESPAAAELVRVCAFLAPEPVSLDLFTTTASDLPDVLAAHTTDPLAWGQLLTTVSQLSLARVDQRGLQLHRLTQAIVRDQLTAGEAAAARACAESVIAASNPGDPADPASWPAWARIMPHLLAADPAGSGNPGLRGLAARGAWYLLARGDTASSYEVARNLHAHWRWRLGDDHADTMRAASCLAVTLRELGQFEEARRLHAGTLSRQQRLLGQDHPDTLATASNLAMDLRYMVLLPEARELDEDTLARRRRLLGADHPDALIAARNLASDLRELGLAWGARRLDEDTLTRQRRVLGEDHPETLLTASNLAADLRWTGKGRAARRLDEDTLARQRRVLGEHHPKTLVSESNLATDLFLTGRLRASRRLDEATLARHRQVLGHDHPQTLRAAANVTVGLLIRGHLLKARKLLQDIRASLRRRAEQGQHHRGAVVLPVDDQDRDDDQVGEDERDDAAEADPAVPQHRRQRRVADRADEAEQGDDRADDWPPQLGRQRVAGQEQLLPEAAGDPAATAPAISRPITMSRMTAAHSITKMVLTEV